MNCLRIFILYMEVGGMLMQAVGRVVGSLCVLSARVGDAESAMLASWVSQASFVPPGLTIAVSPALRDLIQLCKTPLYPEIHIALSNMCNDVVYL
jgi:hypothetical protein